MRGSWTLPRWLLLAGALSMATVLVVLALFLAFEKRVAGAAPDYRVVAVGGMEYQAMSGRPVDPTNPVDRRIIAGLSARDRKPGAGEMLFGAFIAFTNDSGSPLRSARRIELRHDAGHVYQPLALPKSNPYAYSSRVIRPGTRIPAHGSPADANLAATGRLVLFRIRAREYRSNGTFELLIHDPLHPGATASLII